MNRCSECGAEVNAQMKFCAECGARLVHSQSTVSYAPSFGDDEEDVVSASREDAREEAALIETVGSVS